MNAPRTRRRWPWIVIGAVVVIAVVAAVALPLLLDVERHRERIADALRDATGWEPELGAMQFSVFGGLVLKVSPASLIAPDGDARVDIDALAVRAGLVPLLRGELAVRRVEIVRPSIDLVREDAESGWLLPIPVADGVEPNLGVEPEAGVSVSVDLIEISDGTLRLRDATTDPPLDVTLNDVAATIRPTQAQAKGSARLESGGKTGRLAWSGNLDRGLLLELNDVPTELLAPLVGPDLIHDGGTVGGELTLRMPLAVEGRLTLRDLKLLAGERRLSEAQLELRAAENADGISTEFELRAGDAAVEGRGSLTPELHLQLEIPSAPLEPAMHLARAVLPVPLDLQPPGTVQATAIVDALPGEEPTYEATGTISAASIALSEMLPPVEAIETTFELSREGELTLDLGGGSVAGGALSGRVGVASIEPLAPVVFDGGLADASVGPLLAGFVSDAVESIVGNAEFNGRVALDLDREVIDASAIRGRLELGARELSLPGWDLERAIENQLRQRAGALASLLDRDSDSSEDSGPDEVRAFDDLALVVDLDERPWKLERFRLVVGDVSANGRGTLDPVTGNVAADFSATLNVEKTAELMERYPEVRLLVARDNRLTLPLSVAGPLVGPQIGIDLSELGKMQLGEDPEDTVKGLLRNLLDKKDKKKNKK
ncbi:MAG: DUF748 domain-containing protein [bacterium]|nr:DUF748 domain-containing protein [bacterium]